MCKTHKFQELSLANCITAQSAHVHFYHVKMINFIKSYHFLRTVHKFQELSLANCITAQSANVHFYDVKMTSFIKSHHFWCTMYNFQESFLVCCVEKIDGILEDNIFVPSTTWMVPRSIILIIPFVFRWYVEVLELINFSHIGNLLSSNIY